MRLHGRVLVLAVIAVLAVPASTQATHSRSAALTGIYRGSDGGAIYLRQIGSKVYGFGEHPGAPDYAFVLSGTVSGGNIVGSWADVPKGARTLRGSLALRWLQGGARIERTGGADFGPDVLTALPAGTSIPWAGQREAGFQAKKWSDLDGAFRGDDTSTHYVRERGGVVWFAEYIPQLGVRPTWATVFIGSKTSTDAIRGVWVDLPKGTTAGTGGFVAVRQRIDRSLVLGQAGVSRTKDLAPDWALDMNEYAKTMRDALDGNVVGYAWAVAKHGSVVRFEAGGSRRLAQDGGVLPFTRTTQNSAASTTKLVTAVAVMRLLQEKKLPVTTKVADYLPKCWKKTGKDIDKLTFQNLLDHSSKIDRALGQTACAEDAYECLRRSIEAGQTGSAGYDNINYSLFRYLIPLVDDYKTNNAFFEKYDCGDGASQAQSKLLRGGINSIVSNRFDIYVRSRLLKPFGIIAGYSSSGDNWAYGYDFSKPTANGQAPNEKALLNGGSGGMKWSADAYARFLGALDQGKIVPLATVRQMKALKLGFNGGTPGDVGSYYTKDGGAGNFASRAMMYPGRTSVFVTLNSRKNAIPMPVRDLLVSAFDDALK